MINNSNFTLSVEDNNVIDSILKNDGASEFARRRANILRSLCDDTKSVSDIALANRISDTAVYDIAKQYKENGLKGVFGNDPAYTGIDLDKVFTMGVFFYILTKCKKSGAFDADILKTLSDITCDKDRYEIWVNLSDTPFNTDIEEMRSSASTNANNFKLCRTNGDNFLECLQGDNKAHFASCMRDEEKHRSLIGKMKLLTTAYLYSIQVPRIALILEIVQHILDDSSIADDTEFIIDVSLKPTKKKDLPDKTGYCLESFLLGVWDYLIAKGNNSLGKNNSAAFKKKFKDTSVDIFPKDGKELAYDIGMTATCGIIGLLAASVVRNTYKAIQTSKKQGERSYYDLVQKYNEPLINGHLLKEYKLTEYIDEKAVFDDDRNGMDSLYSLARELFGIVNAEDNKAASDSFLKKCETICFNEKDSALESESTTQLKTTLVDICSLITVRNCILGQQKAGSDAFRQHTIQVNQRSIICQSKTFYSILETIFTNAAENFDSAQYMEYAEEMRRYSNVLAKRED